MDFTDAGSTAPQASIAATEKLEEWYSGDEDEVGCASDSHPDSNEATPAIVPGHRRSARLSQPTPLELPKMTNLEDQIEDEIEDLPATQPEMHLKSPGHANSSSDLNDMRDWEVKPSGRAISASLTPFGSCPGASQLTFYRAVSMLRDERDPAYSKGSTVIHSVGDTVLIEWARNDPKEPQGSFKDQAVCRIMAIFADKDGLMCFIPQWGRSWSDVVMPYSSVDTVEPDDELRGSREVFWEAEKGGPWDDAVPLPLVERGLVADRNFIHNISRSCVVRHKDEFETEEELKEYLEQPDTYFYRYSLPHAGPLRFESLPRPGAAPEVEKRILSAPLRMVDVFCGSGAVSDAASEVGWSVSLGVENDLKAFQTYARNCPNSARIKLSVQDYLELVREGCPNVPGRGQVDWLHVSPPCQSLCQQNAHKGIDRFDSELRPLLQCIQELILEVEPKYITIEEVPRFLYAKLPKVQYTKRTVKRKTGREEKQAQAKKKRCEDESGSAAAEVGDNEEIEEEEDLLEESDFVNDDGEEDGPGNLEVEVDLDEGGGDVGIENDEADEAGVKHDALVKDEKSRLSVRPWLHVVPALLTSDWQVDMRVLNSAHYGVPQARGRLFLFAARRGYELPAPPLPQYHSNLRHVGFTQDACLATMSNWSCLMVHSDPSLPHAVTALEAIDDLPRIFNGSERADRNGKTATKDINRGWAGQYVPRDAAKVSKYSRYMRVGAPPQIFDHERCLRTCGTQLNPHKPFGTIIGQDDRWSKAVHYAEHRALSLLERRRAQSFPDRLHIGGSLSEQLKIVGNAVPWLMARAVAASVLEAATGHSPEGPSVPMLKGWTDANGADIEIEDKQHTQQEARKGKTNKPSVASDASPSRPPMPLSPDTIVEVKKYGSRKLKNPVRMHPINAYFPNTSPGASGSAVGGGGRAPAIAALGSPIEDCMPGPSRAPPVNRGLAAALPRVKDEALSNLIEGQGEVEDAMVSGGGGSSDGDVFCPSSGSEIEIIDLTMDEDSE